MSIQLNKYTFLSVVKTPFWQIDEIIFEGATFSRQQDNCIFPGANISNTTAVDASLLTEHGGSTTIVGDHLWWCKARA